MGERERVRIRMRARARKRSVGGKWLLLRITAIANIRGADNRIEQKEIR